jgi:hypothetical protein
MKLGISSRAVDQVPGGSKRLDGKYTKANSSLLWPLLLAQRFKIGKILLASNCSLVDD